LLKLILPKLIFQAFYSKFSNIKNRTRIP